MREAAYNNQFLSHGGPRGNPNMPPSGMGQSRPSSMGPMYAPQGQRMPQHPGYPPGAQQAQLRPPQGLKRPYNPEVTSPMPL